MKILHVDASILGDASASRAISAAAVERLAAENPGAEIVRRDLAAHPLPHLSGAHLAAAGEPSSASPETLAEAREGARALEEFLAADVVVIGAPMYNFTVPSQLKSWIDRIMVAGRTFAYGEDGVPKGLAGDKRVIVALTRGGLYGADTPRASAEHVESYLRAAFAFIGVTEPEFLLAEGLMMGPQFRETAMASALDAASRLEAERRRLSAIAGPRRA